MSIAVETPSVRDCENFARTVDRLSCLEGGVLSPTAGSRRVKLCSLREVEAFLLPISDEDDAGNSRRERIYYLDPTMLVDWVHDVIGDAWLSERLAEVVATDQPYGLLVPPLKQLLSDRMARYTEVLDPEGSGSHE